MQVGVSAHMRYSSTIVIIDFLPVIVIPFSPKCWEMNRASTFPFFMINAEKGKAE